MHASTEFCKASSLAEVRFCHWANRARLPLASGTGLAALDAALAGGGWPQAGVIELLQDQPGMGEWQLLLPRLQALQQASPGQGQVALVAPPHEPWIHTLHGSGLDTTQLLLLQPPGPQQAAWATEQLLRCAEVTAVLAWLPQLTREALRRLQRSARHAQRTVWIWRPPQARYQPSPASLRLWLKNLTVSSTHGAQLRLQVLKQLGGPRGQELTLGLPAPWQDWLQASARQRARWHGAVALTQEKVHDLVGIAPVAAAA